MPYVPQEDPIPLDALIGRLTDGGTPVDDKSIILRDKVRANFTAINDLCEAMQHMAGIPDWDLQMNTVSVLKRLVLELDSDFREFAEHRKLKEREEAEMPTDPLEA